MKNRTEKDVVIPGAEGNRESTVKQGNTTLLTAGLPVNAGNDSVRAFTLIELLVVVLIIGILAAIALPQYRLAVLRAKMTQAFSTMHALEQAQTAYYLANGTFTTNLEDLGETFPTVTSQSC